MQKVVIFGARDLAQVACAVLESDDRFTVAAFTVHEAHMTARQVSAYDVVPFESIEERFPLGPFSIGENSFVLEASVIQPFVTIGHNVVIWSGSHLGHHMTIGNDCFLSSHVVAGARPAIGEGCFIGLNATIRDGVTVAPHCVIGAGTLIMRDTREGEVYRAEPTRPAPYPSHKCRM